MPARLRSPWPFWLLIAGWLCANIPATVMVHGFVWLKGAVHFSHNDELRREVAALLTGVPRASSPRLAAAAAAQRSLPPATPVPAGFKKVDLAFSPRALVVIAPAARGDQFACTARVPAEPVTDVPHPPPRTAGLV